MRLILFPFRYLQSLKPILPVPDERRRFYSFRQCWEIGMRCCSGVARSCCMAEVWGEGHAARGNHVYKGEDFPRSSHITGKELVRE